MAHRKKIENGRKERPDLLRPVFPDICHLKDRPSGVGKDDLLDAAAAAWTARQVVSAPLSRTGGGWKWRFGTEYPMSAKNDSDLHARILAMLKDSGIPFDHMEHEHVHTSEEAARVRRTNIEEAAKALIFETGSGKLVLCIAPGHRRVDLKKLRNILGEGKITLAAPERVLQVAGCAVGCVPPFGNLFSPPLPVYVDEEVLSRERIVFSAGSHYHSIRMRPEDWLKLVQPVVGDLRRDED